MKTGGRVVYFQQEMNCQSSTFSSFMRREEKQHGKRKGTSQVLMDDVLVQTGYVEYATGVICLLLGFAKRTDRSGQGSRAKEDE